jgi:hypothetical protein
LFTIFLLTFWENYGIIIVPKEKENKQMVTNWIAIFSNKQTGSAIRTITIGAVNIVDAAKIAQSQAREGVEVVTRLLKA